MEIKLHAVAIVKNNRTTPTDDSWGEVISQIELADNIPTIAFDNIAEFSHSEIIYCFDKVDSDDIVFSGRPRGNPNYPEMGIFAIYFTSVTSPVNLSFTSRPSAL